MNYFICRPSRRKPNGMPCRMGEFYVRFYSRDPWPWYQAGVTVRKRSEILLQFREFIRDCEKHRNGEYE